MYSRYEANRWINERLRGAQSVYLGVFQGPEGLDANDPLLWREVPGVGTGYARVGIGAGTALSFAAPASGVTANEQDVYFPQALLGWDTLTHFALFDAATAGNVLTWDPLVDLNGDPVSRIVYAGDVLRFLAGQLIVSLT